MIARNLSDDPQAAAAYQEAIRRIREVPAKENENVEGQILKEEQIDPERRSVQPDGIAGKIVIGAIILIALLAVFLGSRRRRKRL